MKGFLWGILIYLFIKFGDKLLDRLFDYFIDKYTMPWIIRVHQAYKKNLFQIQLLLALLFSTIAIKTGLLSEQKERQLIFMQLVIFGFIALLLIAQRIDSDKKRLATN